MATASDLDRGSYFMYNREPVRVLRKEVISVGTHSHTKLKFYVQGLFTPGTKAVVLAHQDSVEMLDITRKTAQIVSKSDDKVQIMDIVSYEMFDADIDPELSKTVAEGDNVVFVEYNGKCIILEKK